MKKASYAYAVLFFLALLIPLVLIDIRADVKSELDNRKLTEFPRLGADGFQNAVESYLQDRLGLRDWLVTGYQVLNDKATGELTHPYYMYGKDGYTFFKMHNNIEYGDYHRTFVEAVVKMKDYCEQRGVPFYFMFDPEKMSVYKQYLPIGVNYSDVWVDMLLNNMREHGVKVVDNRELLIEKSKEEQVFNKQYDAGHWNDLGCFYATNNLWNTVHKDFPAVTEYTLDDFFVENVAEQYFASSRFKVFEDIPVFELKTKWENVSENYEGIKLDSRYPFFQYYVNKSKDSDELPRMLVFHGSYYNRGPQFFIGRVKEYIGIHDYQNVLNLDYYFNLFQPDMVVFEAAEYTLNDTYFDSVKMASLDYNPSDLVNEVLDSDGNIREETLYVIPGNQYDRVYIDAEIWDAQYSAIVIDGKAYDFHKKCSNESLEADLPHNMVANTSSLIYKDYLGDSHIIRLKKKYAQYYVKDTMITTSNNVTMYNGEITLTSNNQDNVFSGIYLQLLDKASGTYLETIDSKSIIGNYESKFRCGRNSGWYKLRLKANANMQDESVDVNVYLERGETYHCFYEIEELERKEAKVKDFKVFGACPYILDTGEELFDCEASLSNGCVENNGKLKMTTQIEDNAFNSVVLQIFEEHGEYIANINSTTNPGSIVGFYVNELPTGLYRLMIRGNSNMADETLETIVELKRGDAIQYKINVDSIGEKEIVVGNISVRKISIIDQ